MSVVVVGSINADLNLRVSWLPRPGETLLGKGGSTTPGGKGANQALAARLAGAETSMVGAVGTDALADTSLELLRQAGVDLSAVEVVEGPTGLAVVSVDDEAENAIVVVAGANAAVTPELVEKHAAVISGADVVVVQGELPAESVTAVAGLVQSRLLVNLAPVIALSAEVLQAADPLVVNEHEAAGALDILGVNSGDTDESSMLQSLLDAGVASVVLTVGARGALIGTPGGIVQVPSPRVTAVDTVGAGDGFVGALAARLAEQQPLVEAARHAVRFAAASVQHTGAQPSYPQPGDALPE